VFISWSLALRGDHWIVGYREAEILRSPSI